MFNVLEIMLIRKGIISFNEINIQIFQNKIKGQSSARKGKNMPHFCGFHKMTLKWVGINECIETE